jgi:hypothetical protein
MRSIVRLVLLFAVAFSATAAAPKQTAGEFYVGYATALANMKKLEDITPYMPKSQAAMMAQAPKEMTAEILKSVRSEAVVGIKVLKETPVADGTIVEMEGTKQATKRKVKGWAKVIREDGALKLEKDDWSGNPPPAAPKIPASVSEKGKAAGEFTVNEKTAPLKFAYARAVPYTFDPSKTAYEVTLSDVPWKPMGDVNEVDHIKAGSLHLVTITIGPDKQVSGTMLKHREFKQQVMSSAGSDHKFEAETLGPDLIAGKAYMEAPQSPTGERFYYAATFRAALEKPAKK